MDIILILLFIFASLLVSLWMKISIIYPLLLGLILLIGLYTRKNYRLKELLAMTFKGAKRSLLVIRIFVLIGAITAVWRASGTVAFIVYYGLKLMNPNYFILSSFIMSCIVSFLLGTSFGTVGTVGVVLMVMAKSGGVDINVLAGAVIAGAYFGDRCSPMSSSANLVASLTETELYGNIKNMLKTTVLPFVLAIAAYSWLSPGNALSASDMDMGNEIKALFDISPVVIFPAAIILLLALFRVDVKLSMAISILSGIIIAVLFQGESILAVGKYLLLGYSKGWESFFMSILKGGGLVSMLKVALTVLISSAYSGLFEGTELLKAVEQYIEGISSKIGAFATTILLSIVTASFGCTQALAIMLTQQLAAGMYKRKKKSKQELALDIEDTAVVISPLVPWNIAGAVPAAALTAGLGFIPYAVYLYILPATSYIAKKLKLVKYQ